MKPRELQRWINRQRVLLSIYAHLDDWQPCAWVRNTQMAEEAGIGVTAVKSALADLESAGLITIVYDRHRPEYPMRVVVPMDDPDAANFVEFAGICGLTHGYTPDWREVGDYDHLIDEHNERVAAQQRAG